MAQKLQAQIPLYIYLHTHWDREWFLPFNTGRALLIDRMKKTLSALESKELPNFYLDGQAVVLEDMLEIEPSFENRIKKAMKQELLSAGPWYVLPDQSLVGGESLIRNLKLGIEIVRRFGQPTMTGYNPDTFCHVQDLPRILKGCNIDTAFVLRGVPPLKTNVFWWSSPDGSKVLTYWLNKGLSHPIFHKTTDAEEIAGDLRSRWDLDAVDEKNAPMLYSSGGEGMQPPGDVKAKLERLNTVLPKACKAKIVSMEEFIADLSKWAEHKKLPEISGDLRDNSGANEHFPAYVLDGVTSTRLYLKRENALAEHRLVRMTEPLYALMHALSVMSYPENELAYLWKLLIQNHPHDSICGCSVDVVHRDMQNRTQQLNTFLDGLDFVAREKIAEWQSTDFSGQPNGKKTKHASLPAIAGLQPEDPDNGNTRLLVYNTSGSAQQAPIKFTWYSHPDSKVNLSSKQFQVEDDSLETNHVLHSGGGFYYKPVKRTSGWFWPDSPVPSLGVSEWLWGGPALGAKISKSAQIADTELNGNQISNGFIRVKVDKEGNLIVSSAEQNFKLGHHLYDVGDAGDSYNFDPINKDVAIKAKFVKVEPAKAGPLVSSIVLTYVIDIPAGLASYSDDLNKLDNSRSKDLITHTIQTEISLKKGVPILFFQTVFENHSRDHRLSVRFKMAQKVERSWSECHFSLAERLPVKDKLNLPVPIGHEITPESYFSQRFFIANGQVFFNSGLPEYRMENDSVEITLLRGISYLSRGRLRTRGGGAGPWLPTPEANCIGISHCDYAWAFLGKSNSEIADEQIEQAYRLADLFEGRLIAFPLGKFIAERHLSLITIVNPAMYVTALYVNEGQLYLRLLNVTGTKQNTEVKTILPVESAAQVNLLGENAKPVILKKESTGAAKFHLDFKGNELITIALKLL